MTFAVSLWRGAGVLLAGLLLSGCLPSAQSQLEEEKEPHFIAGKSQVNAMDFKGAIESFEKAIEVNPNSASAHFELGWLYDQKEADPAAAIYHYERYLRLLQNPDKAETVKTRILACKQELARTVSLGPVTQTLQREFEQLAEKHRLLTETNRQMQVELDKWRTGALRVVFPTNQSGNTPPVFRLTQPPGSGRLVSTAGPPANPPGGERPSAGTGTGLARTHTVKSGETLAMIGRKYGVKVEALLAANPKVDPRRMRVGQALNIPAP